MSLFVSDTPGLMYVESPDYIQLGSFPDRPWFETGKAPASDLDLFDGIFMPCLSEFTFFPFGHGTARGHLRTKILLVPYWSFVIPLTLFSSFLLLSKPLKSTSEKITEPVNTEGA
jgi:hypothetical protein